MEYSFSYFCLTEWNCFDNAKYVFHQNQYSLESESIGMWNGSCDL